METTALGHAVQYTFRLTYSKASEKRVKSVNIETHAIGMAVQGTCRQKCQYFFLALKIA